MTRHYGTRFTTGCGHSWVRKYPEWDIRDLSHATTDCRVCGELLIIPGDQFSDTKSRLFAFNIHMPLFHRYLHEQDDRWPVDGVGTGYIEIVDDEAQDLAEAAYREGRG